MFTYFLINILIFFLMILLLLISMWMKFNNFKNREKMSPYECGFNPLKSSATPFSLAFFFICIMFLIFDIELTLLIPAIPLYFMNNFNWFKILIILMLILILGIFLEWFNNAMIWNK